MFSRTIRGFMMDIGYYPIHKSEIRNIESMSIPQLIIYCLFCFGIASIGLIFLISQGVIGIGIS